MYRVHLWAVHFKMYLSGTIATEVPSFPTATVNLEPSVVRVMEHVKVLPSVMSAIIDCVGRVETPAATYFACYAEQPATAEAVTEYRATTINPDSIRALLDLATHGAEGQRQRLRALWSIPGARFSEDGRLENGDDIYPAVYGADQLLLDIQTYMTFTIRLRKRFPPHLIRDIVWSGQATAGMLWSTPILEISLQSQFQVTEAVVVNRRKKRQDGSYVEAGGPEIRAARYLRTTVPIDGLSRFTSPQTTSDLLSVIGCTSIVSRDYIGHPSYTDATPLSTMRAMLYAP